jgi:hypothetical protein
MTPDELAALVQFISFLFSSGLVQEAIALITALSSGGHLTVKQP